MIYKLRLDIIYKNIKINITDYLPCLKEGYFLFGNEIHILFKRSAVFEENNSLLKEYSIDNNNYSNFINTNIKRICYVDEALISTKIKIGKESGILNSLNRITIDAGTIPNMYEILEICINNESINNNLLDIITKNNDMKVIYNIIKGNFNIVKSILDKNNACPFIGYSIARLKNDDKINTYIESICIKRVWFIKQTLLITDSDIRLFKRIHKINLIYILH